MNVNYWRNNQKIKLPLPSRINKFSLIDPIDIKLWIFNYLESQIFSALMLCIYNIYHKSNTIDFLAIIHTIPRNKIRLACKSTPLTLCSLRKCLFRATFHRHQFPTFISRSAHYVIRFGFVTHSTAPCRYHYVHPGSQGITNHTNNTTYTQYT